MQFADLQALMNTTVTAKSRTLTGADLTLGLVEEALIFLARPLSVELRDKPQLVFNQQMAKAMLDSDKFEAFRFGVEQDQQEPVYIPSSISSLLTASIMRVNAARQAEAENTEAEQGLEMYLNMLTSIAQSAARSAYFMMRRADEVEAARVRNAHGSDFIEGKSDYAGFAGAISYDSADVRDAAESIVDLLANWHATAAKFATQWFQRNRAFNCGGRVEDGVFIGHLTAQEVWSEMDARGRELERVSPTQAASALLAILQPKAAPATAEAAPKGKARKAAQPAAD